LLRQSVKISIHEGVYAQIYSALVSIGNSFVTKFAVLLNASPVHFSFISAISQLSQIFQLIAIKLAGNSTHRKQSCIKYAWWGRALNLLLFIPLLITNPTLAISILLLILLVSAALQNISGNFWTAWISDLIPKRIRGRFFSKRMQILLFFSMIVAYVFSFLIDFFDSAPGSLKSYIVDLTGLKNVFQPSNQTWGVYIVFLIGTLLGLYGLKLLSKQPESLNDRHEIVQNISILEPLKNKNFRKLVFFNIWWMLAIGIGAPFWGPFMMKKLHMSLFEMQIYSSIQTITMLIAFKYWGKFIDRFGNKTTMKICVFLGGINPLIWLLFKENSYYLIWPEAVLSGFMWSGANIVAMNFVLAISPKGKEQVWSAMYGSLGGVMMMTTMLLSGSLFPEKMTFLGLNLEPEQVLFGLSGVIRMSAEIPLFFVHEESAVPPKDTISILTQNIFNRFYKKND
jgi:hypothetical protein